MELVEIDVQRAIETEGSGDGRDNLGDKPVQVGEARGGNTEPLLADIVDGLIVNLIPPAVNILTQKLEDLYSP